MLSCKQFCCQVKEIGENEIISLLAPSVVLTLGSRLGRGLCSRAGPQSTISAISDISSVTSPEHRGRCTYSPETFTRDERTKGWWHSWLALDQFEANGTKWGCPKLTRTASLSLSSLCTLSFWLCFSAPVNSQLAGLAWPEISDATQSAPAQLNSGHSADSHKIQQLLRVWTHLATN